MVHVCMNTQPHTSRNTYTCSHLNNVKIQAVQHNVIVDFPQSLYRACIWLVLLQGILQASAVTKVSATVMLTRQSNYLELHLMCIVQCALYTSSPQTPATPWTINQARPPPTAISDGQGLCNNIKCTCSSEQAA